MRILFLALVLINVAVYLQISSHAQSEVAFPAALSPGVERLRLLSELPPAINDPGKADQPHDESTLPITNNSVKQFSEGSARITVAGNASQCVRLGPFTDADSARSVQDLLVARIPGVTLMATPEDVADGYWLLYPKASTMEVARSNRSQLQQKGIKDAWLIEKGEMQGAISLGLYASREEAEIKRMSLLKQGVPSQVQVRMSRTEHYWLKFLWGGSQQELDEVFIQLRGENTQVTLGSPMLCGN